MTKTLYEISKCAIKYVCCSVFFRRKIKIITVKTWSL